MRPGVIIAFVITAIVLIAIDLYVWKGIKLVSSNIPFLSGKRWIPWTYWTISIVSLLLAFAFLPLSRFFLRPADYVYFYTVFGVIILFFVPKLVFVLFHAVEDLSRLAVWIGGFFSPSVKEFSGQTMSRFDFISRIGLIAAAVPFFGVLYGMLRGRFNFKTHEHKLAFKNLPRAFDGFRIVQISDLHLGSFYSNFERIDGVMDKINDLKPDVILFTGDLVNNYASETEGWDKVFRRLSARMGKFSILGNHDYGDYGSHGSEEAKEQNFQGVLDAHEKMDFRLLRNENLKLEKDGSFISLIGVENWGKGGFQKYGDLPLAMQGVDDRSFKVLMSHDPSHWDEQVMDKTDIDLTLSGHTHGMQFGVEIPGIKWSPVQYRYPRWAGMYNSGRQFLNVNRGFGYIGFPGRVGIMPEITVIELQRA